MKYNELEVNSYRKTHRVGRGIAAGQGKTAGRGTKGQGARTGSSAKPGFTGGQNPLMQKLPKLPGFRSHKIPMENVHTAQLHELGAKVIDNQLLADRGLITNPHVRVKLLLGGEITTAFTVKLQAASASAIDALEKAGGSFVQTAQIGRTRTEKAEKTEATTKRAK